MNLTERIKVLTQLGRHLSQKDDYLEAVMHRSMYHNGWFTLENQQQAVEAIHRNFLDEQKLRQWIEKYDIPEETPSIKNVGIVMAGNIPLVGFHDLVSVFLSGHRAMIKMSDKDPYLLPYLLKLLGQFDERTKAYFQLVDRLKDFDAVIATGSNNSSRYFDHYFSEIPNIIRKNRNAIAVLSGAETEEELKALGQDVFNYFGLGCRNVAKIYVPEGYSFEKLMEALHEYRAIVRHNKYKNNFDYNFAIQVLNKVPYYSNGCILLIENKSLQSRVGELYFEYYKNPESLENEIHQRAEEIQCVVARNGWLQSSTIPFGKAQQPELWDYADGVDTLDFLLNLE
jgi:hypothetical protein